MSTILHHPSTADPQRGETFVSEAAPATSNQYLTQWLACSILIEESWQALPAETQDELSRCGDHSQLLSRLVAEELLTPYQADRARTSKPMSTNKDRLPRSRLATWLTRSPRRWSRLTASISSTETSSRPTFGSRRKARPGCSTLAWPAIRRAA